MHSKVLFYLSHKTILFLILHKQAANIEPEASGLHDGEYQLTKHEFSSLGRGKYSGTIHVCVCYYWFLLYIFCHVAFSNLK